MKTEKMTIEKQTEVREFAFVSVLVRSRPMPSDVEKSVRFANERLSEREIGTRDHTQ